MLCSCEHIIENELPHIGRERSGQWTEIWGFHDCELTSNVGGGEVGGG